MGHTKKEKCSMKMLVLFNEYKKYLYHVRPLALTTTRNYVCRVEKFVLTLPPDATTATHFTRQIIVRYLYNQEHPRAVRMHHAALQHFCAWLLAGEYLRTSPMVGIELPALKRTRRKPVPEDAIVRLMDACDRLPTTPYRQALARASLCLLVFGALRRCECIGLRVEDVDLSTGDVFIQHGKGGKSRTIRVCSECVDAVRVLLELRPECNHDKLLAQTTKWGMGEHGLRALIVRLHTVAGLEEVYVPHRLRHSCASRMEVNGAPLSAIQEFLGHEHLSTTYIYLHGMEGQAKQIAHLASLSAMPPAPQNTQNTQKQPAPVERRRVAVRRLR
jgi:integrase/recombinase XerC